MRVLALALLLLLATASPSAAKPWWLTYLESRRSTHDYLERQREAERDRRYVRCLRDHNYKADRCPARGGRRHGKR